MLACLRPRLTSRSLSRRVGSQWTVLAFVVMDPLLAASWPPPPGRLLLTASRSLKLFPASDLHSRITLLRNAARALRAGSSRITLYEDAMRACRAELQRRPSHCQEAPQPQPAASSSSCMLLQLGHDEIGVVAHALYDPVRPLLAVNLGSTANGLRVPMQAALAEAMQEVKAFVALTGRATIAQLRNARSLELGSPNPNEFDDDKPLTLAHWRALGTLIGCGSLPRLKELHIHGDDCGGEGVHMLAAGLRRGGLPSLRRLALIRSQIGDQAASALASALTTRAVPSLEHLQLSGNQIGDVGLVALAPALRQLPTLEMLHLCNNLISDRGLAALIAQPMTGVLEQLETLALSGNHITDAGCLALASVLRNEALPNFNNVDLREDTEDEDNFSLAHWELFESREGLGTDMTYTA